MLLIIEPLISYYLYKPGLTHSSKVASLANNALNEMGKLTRKEYILIGLVLLSLWVFVSNMLNATAVCLLVVSLMLALQGVSWKDITKYYSAWNTLINLATLVVMANGLTRSSFIDWFARTMSTHLDGFSPNMAVIALVLVFYFANYLFASLSAHTVILLLVILAVGKGLPGVPLEQLSMLLVLSIGIMEVLTPYATVPGVIIYGCSYLKSKDYWRLGGHQEMAAAQV